ncbi:MAG: hypothetical protein K0Q73_4918 [Paenibacillus sp.]|nr:hypothetical protein [Paenibacillus sp.]
MSTFISNNYLAQQREYIFQTYRDLHDLAEPSWYRQQQ